MSLSVGAARSDWMNLYSRTVGCIQVLYGLVFGRYAILGLRWTAEEMISIAQKGFNFQGTTSKGVYRPALDLETLAVEMVFLLLSLCCLVGGYGLLRLLPWARRWVIIYLIVITVYSLWEFATAVRMGHDFGHLVLFFMAFTLPYLPLLLTSPPPRKAPPFSKAKAAKATVADLSVI